MGEFHRRFFLASTLAVTAGCRMLPDDLTAPGGESKNRNGSPIGLFKNVNGTASLTLRLIDDRRRRAVQDLADADDYNAVLFRLTNSKKLKSQQLAVATPQNGTYDLVFSGLPSDSGNNYTLVAGLFRSVPAGAGPTHAAFASIANKVGEGASSAFSLAPGENKTVTIRINAVGEISFTSSFLVLDEVSPVFRSGDTSITIDTGIARGKNPEADGLVVHVVDSENATQSSAVVPLAKWPDSGTATASLEIPTLAGGTTTANYNVIIDLLAGSSVLSRRQRVVTVEATASLGGNLSDPTPTPGTGGEDFGG